MKMNYLLDKQSFFSNNHYARKTGHKKFLWLLLLVLLLGGGVLVKIFSAGATLTTIPLTKNANNLSLALSANLPFLSSKVSLVRENNELKKTLQEARLALIQSKSQVEELMILTKEINYQPNALPRVVVAKVLAHSGLLAYDTLIIDKGSRQSAIKPGDVVIAGENILLGEVVQVFSTTAKVKLYSSAGRKTAVKIGPTNISGLATGLSGGNFLVNLPINVLVKHNDLVRKTVGDREYILGLVGLVEKTEQVPVQKVYFKPLINIYEIRFVSIIAR